MSNGFRRKSIPLPPSPAAMVKAGRKCKKKEGVERASLIKKPSGARGNGFVRIDLFDIVAAAYLLCYLVLLFKPRPVPTDVLAGSVNLLPNNLICEANPISGGISECVGNLPVDLARSSKNTISPNNTKTPFPQ